MLLCRVVEIF